jgi:hypothetical protein
MTEYVLTEEAAREAFWELTDIEIHRSFPGYLGLKWASSKAGTTDGFQFEYNDFFDTFFKIREQAVGKPYVIPFNPNEDPDAETENMWLQNNAAGSYGPSYNGVTFGSMVEDVSGRATSADWELVDDYWTVARDDMPEGDSIPVELVAAFLLRDFVIEMDNPGAEGLVEAFRDEFGYDESDSDYNALYLTGTGHIDADDFEQYDSSMGSGSGTDATTSSKLQGKMRDMSPADLGLLETAGPSLDLDKIDIDGLSDDTSFDRDDVEDWMIGLKRKKQAIFYGPPGTGKTFTAKKIADELVDGTDGFTDILQFHQNYEYEDFIQGIRPSTDGSDLSYSLESGTFLDFCEEAGERSSPCVLIIDEINRADLSSVFGELMYLLEYREDDVQLAQSQVNEDDPYLDEDGFEIPDNVYIMGTMNTADRSIALVDFALRRRFAFLELDPNWDVLDEKFSASGVDVDDLIDVLKAINDDIGDSNYELGHTYFLEAEDRDEVRNIWKLEIVPYLEEYFIDQDDKVDNYRWDEITDSTGKYDL